MNKHLRINVSIDAIGYIIGKNNRNINRIMDNNMNVSILLVKTNPFKPYFEIKGYSYNEIIIVVKDIMGLCISFRNKRKGKLKGIKKIYIPKPHNYLKYTTKERDFIIDNNDLELLEYRPYTPDYSPPDL